MTSSLRGPDTTEAGCGSDRKVAAFPRNPISCIVFHCQLTTESFSLSHFDSCLALTLHYSQPSQIKMLQVIWSMYAVGAEGFRNICSLPALPSWYRYAEPPYTCLYFFQISSSFLSKLNCAKSLVQQCKHSHIHHQYFYSVASLAGSWQYSNKHPSNK